MSQNTDYYTEKTSNMAIFRNLDFPNPRWCVISGDWNNFKNQIVIDFSKVLTVMPHTWIHDRSGYVEWVVQILTYGGMIDFRVLNEQSARLFTAHIHNRWLEYIKLAEFNGQVQEKEFPKPLST